MLADDKDVIRAIGYVTIYSSYVEGYLDDFLEQLKLISSDTSDTDKLKVSEKAKSCKRLVRKLASEPKGLCDVLDKCISTLKHRNEITHGRIYAGLGGQSDRLVSNRDGSARDINSSEVYDLANGLDDLQKSFQAMSLRLGWGRSIDEV